MDNNVSVHNMTSRDIYYDPYSYYGTHEGMLRDKVLMTAYRDSMYLNRHLFKDKIVLDVGCGTGILSMFAAKAGAAKVIAIDCSNIVEHTRTIVTDNTLSDKITIVKGKVEEVCLPHGIEEVDIIISDWMGHCLFHKCILSTVLYAKKKWLKRDGLIFPDRCSLFITAIRDKQYKDIKINWWNKVQGFDMSSIRKVYLNTPFVTTIDRKQVVTNTCLLKEVDLNIITWEEETDFSAPFHLQAHRDDQIQAVLTFFKVEFTKCHKLIGFDTAPKSPPTHWKQTAFYLNDCLTVKKRERIFGTFSMNTKKRNNTDPDFVIKVNFKSEQCEVSETNMYTMR